MADGSHIKLTPAQARWLERLGHGPQGCPPNMFFSSFEGVMKRLTGYGLASEMGPENLENRPRWSITPMGLAWLRLNAPSEEEQVARWVDALVSNPAFADLSRKSRVSFETQIANELSATNLARDSIEARIRAQLEENEAEIERLKNNLRKRGLVSDLLATALGVLAPKPATKVKG